MVKAPKRTLRADIGERERILRELQRHLEVPSTGGEASLTVVVDGVKIELQLRATKLLAGAELADVRGYFNAVMDEAPWRIGRGQCGSITTKKSSPWSSRHGSCSKPITGAIVYTQYDFEKKRDRARVSFHCPHHEHSHGIESSRILGVLPMRKDEVRVLVKKCDEYNARQRDAAAAGGGGQ